MVSRILCLSMMLAVESAAKFFVNFPPKPKDLEHKEGCYVKEVNDVIPFGDRVAPLGICYRIECSPRYLYYASCGTVHNSDPKCHVTDVDYSRPYPNCCPNIVCDIDNNLI